MANPSTNQIILGGGCFWCIEAAFQQLPGVTQVESGYAGGHTQSPDYQSVCSGATGHAEVVRVSWDPQKTELSNLLHCFFLVHDPTTLNRQGNDIGTQYRSFIGYVDEQQLAVIDAFLDEIRTQYAAPLTTELQKAPTFYPAEIEHQNYYNDHQNQPYCQIVIRPKLEKLNQSDLVS